MDSQQVLELLQQVAAEVITPRFRALTSDQVSEKHPGDYVTVADREAEVLITDALQAAYPRALIVGEEAVFGYPALLDGLASAEHAFVVDPVDGTRNFVRGNPDHAVMVGELRRGEAVRGWIWQPEHREAYIGEHGAGVTRNGVLLERPQRPARVRGAASTKTVVGANDPGLAGPVTWPSFCCGVDYPRLITGDIDFVCYNPPKPWDHVPGVLMLRELGGVSRTVAGVEYAATVRGPALISAGDEPIYALADRIVDSRISRT